MALPALLGIALKTLGPWAASKLFQSFTGGGGSEGGGRGGMSQALGGFPDNPLGTAQQQHELNLDAARNSAQLSQVNQENPFMRREWTGEIGSPNRTQTTSYQPWLSNILFGPGGPGGGMMGQGGAGTPAPVAGTPAPPMTEEDRLAVVRAAVKAKHPNAKMAGEAPGAMTMALNGMDNDRSMDYA